MNPGEREIIVPSGFCLPDLTSARRHTESLSVGVNLRQPKSRDFSAALLLSARARLGMGDSVMDGSRQIHSSNELMNKHI